LTTTGRSWLLPPRQRNTALALGVVMAWASYALLAAMETMPVALCVITLYTYPFIVAAFGWWSGREPFRLRFAVALVAAFAGLVLALDLSGNPPNVTGLVLAASGAVGVATLLLASERARAPADSQPFTLHMLATCMVLSLLISAARGDFALPQTNAAWLGFIATPLCYSFSIICMFVAVSMIGSLRTALVMNLEPVSSVLLGYVVLSQALDGLQLVGVALVVAAIVSIEGGHAAANKRDA
jgi:drug/metabolite transporter (DMT)-like permease